MDVWTGVFFFSVVIVIIIIVVVVYRELTREIFGVFTNTVDRERANGFIINSPGRDIDVNRWRNFCTGSRPPLS